MGKGNLCNAFNSRELSDTSVFRNLAANRLMLAVFSITFLLQVFITQYGNLFFGTIALPLIMWLKIIAVAFSVIIMAEAVKLVKRVGISGEPAEMQ